MNVLLIGSGVIGSIYAGQLALAGHRVWVLAHGEREQELARQGIQLFDSDTGVRETARIDVVQTAVEREYDLVLVAVQAPQLESTFPALRILRGAPHIVLLGNNPEGHVAMPSDIPGTIELGFPGVGGNLKDGVVEYVHVAQQPTALEVTAPPASNVFQTALETRGFPIRRVAYMDGWLKYHAVFIGCVSMALIKSGADPMQLGNDHTLLSLMCHAIEEGFRLLKRQGVRGVPKNLALLHSPWLRPIALRYWQGIMRSPKGELYFAAHVRHAPNEAETLASWVLVHVVQNQTGVDHLKRLLTPESQPYSSNSR